MLDRKMIRKQLPRGYCTLIAQNAGVTTKSVSEYFAYKLNSERIENEALKALAGFKKDKEELIKAAFQ